MNYANVSRPSASVDDRQVGLHTNYANRERLLDADTGGAPIGAPNIPLLAIRGWLCIRCLAHKPDLKACGACKRVRYCSERCQKVDWKCLHKHHCETFRQINSEEAETTADAGPRSWGPLCDWLVSNLPQESLCVVVVVGGRRRRRETSLQHLKPFARLTVELSECTHEPTS